MLDREKALIGFLPRQHASPFATDFSNWTTTTWRKEEPGAP